jgi:hypothetical protein
MPVFDVPDALEPDPHLAAARLGVPPAAVPVLGPLDRVEPAASPKPRVAGLLPTFHAAEEGGVWLVEPAQRGLLGAERPPALPVRVGSADVLQVAGLLAVPDCRARPLVSGPAVLQRPVVQLPVVFQHRHQGRLLPRRRPDQELIRPPHRFFVRHFRSYLEQMSRALAADTAPTVAATYDSSLAEF